MIKKSITYTDFNDEEVTEDFWFHLSKTELFELESSYSGGMQAMLNRVVAVKDAGTIIQEFKKIILLAYGQMSDDGRRFIKSQELRDSLVQCPAYDVLFMQLAEDSESAAEFINGIIPKNMTKGEPQDRLAPTPPSN